MVKKRPCDLDSALTEMHAQINDKFNGHDNW